METQTLIIAYANNLAKSVGFKHKIEPLKEWKRPVTLTPVGVWGNG